MKRPQLTFSSVTERDVDLLLVEELKCSDRFRNWFLRLVSADLGIGASGAITDVLVLHSVGGGTGESDVRFDFVVDGRRRRQRWALFIENKIDAPFQKEQPQRYRLRAEETRTREDVDEVATVLVAPGEYLNEAQGHEAFDALVSYEDLRKYFETRAGDSGETGARFAHKRDVLEQAIEKYRRGYRAEPDKALTSFWAGYYLLAQEVAAGLKMQKPGPKPANSTWAVFPRALEQKRGLPHCEIAHKWPNEMVDIHLFGLAKHAAVVEPAVEPLLGTGMKLRKASKSLAVSIEVPRLDPRLPFDGQREAAEKGLLAAVRLQKWYQDNRAELRVRISRVVD